MNVVTCTAEHMVDANLAKDSFAPCPTCLAKVWRTRPAQCVSEELLVVGQIWVLLIGSVNRKEAWRIVGSLLASKTSEPGSAFRPILTFSRGSRGKLTSGTRRTCAARRIKPFMRVLSGMGWMPGT